MTINIEYKDGKLSAMIIKRERTSDTMTMCNGEIFMEESESKIADSFSQIIKSLESEFKDFRYTKSLDIKADARKL